MQKHIIIINLGEDDYFSNENWKIISINDTMNSNLGYWVLVETYITNTEPEPEPTRA